MEIISKKRGRKPVEKVKRKNGRPPISEETKNLVVRLYNEDELTCVEIAKSCNISKASVFRIMNERRQLDGTQN